MFNYMKKTLRQLHRHSGPLHVTTYTKDGPTVPGDEELYLHHSKLNMKSAIEGSAWPWHQDFHSWHLDGIKQPDMVTLQ